VAYRSMYFLSALLVALSTSACEMEPQAQAPAASDGWRDPSTHRARFVTVEDGVHLEVLDWGGDGRPVVLLAGSGNSAHVFDDFAPRLTDCCRTVAITRRGYGASSQPESGYNNQRLADDILEVVDALHIEEPVLVGHSMAGGEIATLGNQHSNRFSGLVYLDALGDPRDWPASDPAYRALLDKLPPPRPSSPPCPQNTTTFAERRAEMLCTMNVPFPESELRNIFSANPDGTVGWYKTPPRIQRAIGEGEIKRDYSRIRVPVLAVSNAPTPGEHQPQNDKERAAFEAVDKATKVYTDRAVANLKGAVPAARLVNLPGAGHFVFLTRADEVERELKLFVASLSPRR
jgi:non-heme chloroperoxidase